jgi:type III secretion system low calcium response chaperone LcrH/SycD
VKVNGLINIDPQNPDTVLAALLEHGVTLADAKSVSDEELEKLYDAAYQNLMEGRIQQAADDLVLLVTHDPWDSRFHFAFGLALQFSGRLEAAARSYAYALTLDATNAACVLRIAECLEAQGQQRLAIEALRSCITLSWTDLQYEGVRDSANIALMRLEGMAGASA